MYFSLELLASNLRLLSLTYLILVILSANVKYGKIEDESNDLDLKVTINVYKFFASSHRLLLSHKKLHKNIKGERKWWQRWRNRLVSFLFLKQPI